MAVSAKFIADFTSFNTAVENAVVKLRTFDTRILAVDKTLSRFGNEFSGTKLIGDATAMVKAIESVGGVTRLTAAELQKAGTLAKEAGDKMRALGIDVPHKMEELAHAVEHAHSAWGEFGKEILTSAAGFFSAEVALEAVKHGLETLAETFVELTLGGSVIADVEENFEHLAAASGRLGSTLITTLKTGTHNTITEFDLMKTATQDLAAGMELTDAQFGTLAKGAFALAQATGGDVKAGLDTMNDAMLTGRTRALALLTGKIDLGAAEERYAASIGTTAKHLSDEGKLEAARAGILDAVAAATDRLGEQTDRLDERVAQLHTAWKNFEEDLGKTIATSPVLTAGLDAAALAFTSAFGAGREEQIAAIVHKVNELAIAVVGLAEQGVRVGGFLIEEWFGVKKLFGDVRQVIDGVALATLYLGKSQLALPNAIGLGTAAWKANDEAIGHLLLNMQQRGAALQEDDRAQKSVSTSTQKFTDIIAGIQAAMKKAAEATEHATHKTEELGAAHKHTGDLTKEDAAAAAAAAKHIADLAGKMSGVTEARDLETAFLSLTPAQQANAEIVKGLLVQYSALRVKAGDEVAPALERMLRAVGSLVNLSTVGTKNLIDADGVAHADALSAALMRATVSAEALQTARLAAFGLDRSGNLQSFDMSPEIVKGLTVGLPNGITDNKGSELGNSLLRSLKKTLAADFAPTVLRALEGGGDVVKSVGSLIGGSITDSMFGGSKMATALSTKFGDTLGGMFSSVLPGIGALVGPLVSTIGKAFGKLFGGEGKATNNKRDTFIAQFAGTSDELRKMAAEAGVDLSEFFSAKTPAAFEAAVKKVTAAIEAQRTAVERYNLTWTDFAGDRRVQEFDKRLAALKTDEEALARAGLNHEAVLKKVAQGYIDLATEAVTAGEEIPAALAPTLLALAQMGGLTDDQVTKLLGLTDANTVDFKAMEEAAARYGIKLGELGPKFDQAKLSAGAKTLLDDFTLLTSGGADLSAVIGGMGPQVNDVVQQALRLGLDVPAAMREMLQKFVDAGQLTDENGDKLLDLSRIDFAEPIEKSIDRLIAKLNELIDRLGGVGTAIAGLPDVNVGVTAPGVGDLGGAPLPGEGYPGGTAGRYVNFGAGRAVTLHGRERIMTEGEGRGEGSSADVVGAIDRLHVRMDTLLAALPLHIRDAVLLTSR